MRKTSITRHRDIKKIVIFATGIIFFIQGETFMAFIINFWYRNYIDIFHMTVYILCIMYEAPLIKK